MTITDLLNMAIDKEITYAKAKEELEKLRLPEDKFEEYDMIFQKMLKNEKIFREHIYQLSAIPNELYLTVLQDTIAQVREERYSPEIAQNLYDTYLLNPNLIGYFINEAISIVRMNTITADEVAQIGEAYYEARKTLEDQGVAKDNMKVELTENIKAVQIDEVLVTDE